MVSKDRRREIEGVVRHTRWLIRWIDPARLKDRADDETPLDEYDAPSLEVSRALLNGATSLEAVEILRIRMMEESDATLSSLRARKLRKYFQYRAESSEE